MDAALAHEKAEIRDAKIQGCNLGTSPNPTFTPVPVAMDNPNTDVGTSVVIDSSSSPPASPDDVNFRELQGLTFYVDAGHGGNSGDTNPCTGYSYGGSSTEPNGTVVREADMVLRAAKRLRDLLTAHGARVYMSRETNRVVCNSERINGDNIGLTNPGETIGNNWLYDREGGNTNNWRFISIHLNSTGAGSQDHSEIQVIHQRYNLPPEAKELAQQFGDWIYRTYPSRSKSYQDFRIDYWIRYDERDENGNLFGDPYVVKDSKPYGHGIITENNFVDYAPFRSWVLGSGAEALGYAHYRALVDYWVTGYSGPHSGKNQAVVNSYKSLLDSGRDPGVPFSNGGTAYVHQWGSAITQDFNSPSNTKSSIFYPVSGGPTHFISDRNSSGDVTGIWTKYIQKNGPQSNGPGFPTIGEHSWTTRRGVHWQRVYPQSLVFHYPTTVNFERGAITWNNTEGAVFLPNCKADGVYSHSTIIDPATQQPMANWAKYWTERMVQRFAFSNDLDGPNTSCLNPDNSKCTRYNDNGVHTPDTATRAQIAQILMMAEGYPYDLGGNRFKDINGHWAAPWINMAAGRSIISGYPCGLRPNEPCDAQNTSYFRPDELVSRGQFSKMLVGTRQWPEYNGSAVVFNDVPQNSPFYTWIMKAYEKGIIQGYGDGSFRYNNNVTRGHISKMVDIALTSPNTPYGEPGGCW